MEFKRNFIVVLCIAMLCTTFTGALGEINGTAVLPRALKEIREEAFENADGIEKIIVSQGTERIESRAFADSSLKQIELPSTLTYIADDAFEGCEDLVATVPEGGYAHGWCILNDVKYEVMSDEDTPAEPEYDYARYISNVYGETRTDESGAEYFVIGCEYSAIEANTTITLSVLREDGSKIMSGSAWSRNGSDEPGVYEFKPGTLPEYFLIRAEMRKDDVLQCEPYVCRDFTQAYQSFISKSKDDYSRDRVADFGDSGFAVLAEGVRRIDGEAVDNGDGTYAIATGEDIQPGDALILNVSGTPTPVKVGSVSSAGTYFVIKSVKDLVASDFYAVIHIDTYLGSVAPEETNGNEKKIFQFTQALEAGPVKVSPKIDLGVRLRLDYDRDAEYFDMELYAETSGSFTASFTGKADTRELDYNPMEVILYSGVVIIPGISAPAFLYVTICPDLWAEAGGVAEYAFGSKFGYRTDGNGNLVKINENPVATSKVEVKGDVGASIGPKVELDMTLLGMVSAKIKGQLGLEATGKLEGLSYEVSTEDKDEPIRHACDCCLNVDACFFGYVEGVLKSPFAKNASATLAQVRILDGKEKIGDAFCSFENEAESIYGGKVTADFGTCQNLKYRVKIDTEDLDGDPVNGIPLTVTKHGGSIQSGTSPDEFYLYAGSHMAAANFESGTAKTGFAVSKPWELTIKEPSLILNVTVQDNDTEMPVAGARVTLTMPDGTSTRTTMTNDEGRCVFDGLPGGVYTVTVSANNYDTRIVTDLKYTVNTNNNLTVNMLSNQRPLLFAKSESGKVQALTEEGTCPENVTPVYLNVISEYYSWSYDVESIEVIMEGCETLVYNPNWSVNYVTLTAMDMGNGEYTYVLTAWINGRIGGSEIIVFREKDGKFEILKSFDGTSRSDNIYVDAKFTSDTQCSGTILPTGRKFSVIREADNNKRTGYSLVSNWPGYFYYEENEEGFYNILFATSEKCSHNADTIGNSYTRYIMQDDELVIESQWFEGAGEVTNY